MNYTDVFNCKKCGDCCKGYGGTFVTDKDIKAIAAYLKIDPKDFVKDYCCMSAGKLVLAQQENGYCIFWDKICTIHPVKPKMCKKWPFIEGVLTDINNWQIMGALCPGIRTDAPEDLVRECVKQELLKINNES